MSGINRQAVKALADKKAGLGQLEEFLLEIEPQVRALKDALAKLNAMLDAQSNPIRSLPAIAAGIEWFRLQETDRLFKSTVSTRDRAEQHRKIAERRPATSYNRKVRTKHRELLLRLNEALETLNDFAEVYPKAMNWIENLDGPIAKHFEAGLGSFAVDASIVEPASYRLD